MAREVKIKRPDGEFKKIDLPENYREEFKQSLNLLRKNNEDIARENREYELITPLFGGGAETKKSDEISVVRATEIRGHLRFWWRATRGGQFAAIEKLKEAEDAIFGSTEMNSALQVEIEIKNRGNAFPDQKDHKGEFQSISSVKSPLSYAAFPLRGEEGAKIIENISFSVTLSYPARFGDDINAALWAWENFGGIGARTRRGFGALSLKKINDNAVNLPNSSQIKSAIETSLANFITAENFHKEVPHLSKKLNFHITNKKDSPQKVWQFLINKLQAFRQYRKDKETGKESKFGASQWSEPNALRYRMNRRDEKPTVDKFPRANFGLPILYEMRHDHFKTMLKGRGKTENESIDRLSSPLILKPIKCSDGVVGIALILETPRVPPFGLMLTEVKRNDEVLSELTPEEAKILSERLEPLENQTDILLAFLKFLEK